MERLEQVTRLKEGIKALENHWHCLTEERLPGAKLDFLTLYPKHMEYLTDVYRWEEKFWSYDYQLFLALEQVKNHAILLATLACGAGAEQADCREWYLLISEICSFQRKEEKLPFHTSEYIIYLALSGEYSQKKFRQWPSVPDSQAARDLILYALMTGKPLKIDRSRVLYDDGIWLRFYDALAAGDSNGVKAACIDFARYFWQQCEATGTPVYAPEDYPCFEPDYNAALAIALYRDGMDISFESEQYERFYIGALCRT